MILSILSEEANPPPLQVAIPLFPHHLRTLTSASHFSITRFLLPFPMITPCTLFLYLFLSLHLFPFPEIQLESWFGRDYSPSKKDEVVLTSWKFSGCTNYKGLSANSLHSVQLLPPVVTPQEISKVRRHQDLLYYFFSSHVNLSWNISPQSVTDFSSVNQGRGQNILFGEGYSGEPWRAR